MSGEDLRDLVATATNASNPADARIAAIRRLADADDETALAALVQVSTEEECSAAVKRVVGQTLAQFMIQRGLLGSPEYDLLPFHAWSDELYDAYDNAIARHQRGGK